MDKFEMNELLDFYGGLLTENQQKISNDYFREDYSYQEIAENMNWKIMSPFLAAAKRIKTDAVFIKKSKKVQQTKMYFLISRN